MLVKKRGPDGKITNPPRYRVCLDLRDLDKAVILEPYPNNIIGCLGDPRPQYYSLMDAVSGYLQVPCTKESSKLLGVEMDYNTYVLKRLLFVTVTDGSAGSRPIQIDDGWDRNISVPDSTFKPNEPTGTKSAASSCSSDNSALDLFSLFWNNTLWDLIVERQICKLLV